MFNYTQSQHAGLNLISWYISCFIFCPCNWAIFIPKWFKYSFSTEFPLAFSGIRGRSFF